MPVSVPYSSGVALTVKEVDFAGAEAFRFSPLLIGSCLDGLDELVRLGYALGFQSPTHRELP